MTLSFMHSFLTPFVLLLFFLIALSFIIRLIAKESKSKIFTAFKAKGVLSIYFLVALGFSWLGITIGIFAGNSREPAVNTIISSSLTLIGGIIVYLFDKNALKMNSESQEIGTNFYILIICLVFLPASMLYGAVIGTESRVGSEQNELVKKIDIDQQEKYNDELLRVNEDSIKVLLDIYKDSVEKNYTPKSHK